VLDDLPLFVIIKSLSLLTLPTVLLDPKISSKEHGMNLFQIHALTIFFDNEPFISAQHRAIGSNVAHSIVAKKQPNAPWSASVSQGSVQDPAPLPGLIQIK
jgi:hypothetical protein